MSSRNGHREGGGTHLVVPSFAQPAGAHLRPQVQVSPELVPYKRGLGVGTNAPRIGNIREQSHAGAKTGFAEPKKLCFRSYQRGCEILLVPGKDRWLIAGTAD